MSLTIAMASRETELNDYAAQFGAAAQLAIFSGTAPTNADTALSSNVILANVPFSSTPFSSATAATPSVITANTITQENAIATGTASFFRAYSAGTTGGISTSGFIVGNVYNIATLGTSTSANWISIGLPSGTTAAAGQMFVASATTLTGTGTATLMTTLEQGLVGTSGSDLNLNTTSIVASGPLAVTSFTRQM
jgi:hypothetical protein